MDYLHFNEDTRVKFPATAHILRLGYEYQSLKTAQVDFETKIFINRFKPALEKINNREISEEEIFTLLGELNLLLKNNDLGKEFYNRIISTEYDIKIIDFENINNNDFAVVDELPFSIKEGTEEGSFRPDINILINGMPLAFLEVKHPNNSGGIQVEFERMIDKRLHNDDYKKYFNLIQIVSFSNNMEYEEADDDIAEDVKAGSFYTTPNGFNTSFSFFREDIQGYHSKYQLKEISMDTIKMIVKDGGYNPEETDTPEFATNLLDTAPCNRFITSFYDKERFMYMLHYGIMFLTEIKKIHNATTNKDEEIPIKQKHIMRYPQFFATRAIIKRLGEKDKNGIIWHTQGSGKTALSAYSNRIIKDYFAKKNINARFFFIVDRLDLMTQATTEFSNRGFNVTNVSDRIAFAKELKKPLDDKNEGIGTVCVVNVQKLMEESKMPHVENDYNVRTQRIFFVDEAHRSYNVHGEFFKNLMTCDDNGIYIAMTGTPLLSKKERSNLKFGDYIHKYFYDKSIADGYTLRIKKEQIDTTAKSEIRENLEIEDKNLESADVYESNDYIQGVSKYIEKDFRQRIIDRKWLKGVISMPSNIFANTGTNVSVLFMGLYFYWNSICFFNCNNFDSKYHKSSTVYNRDYDFEIDGYHYCWNAEFNATNFITNDESLDKIGCIYTSQGHDLNYAGVIFGKDISYNKATKSIEYHTDEFTDKNSKSDDENETIKNIINAYLVLLTRGMYGTYIYAVDEDLRDYIKSLIINEDN